MKKLLSVLILSLSIFSIGCNKNEENTVSNDTANNKFEQYNILGISEVDIDTTEEYEGDEYITARVKVTNNSKDIVRDITVDFSGFKDNTIIDSQSPFEGGSINSGQSVVMEGLFFRADALDDIQINSYDYYIGNKYYRVDLISKYVEIGEVVE